LIGPFDVVLNQTKCGNVKDPMGAHDYCTGAVIVKGLATSIKEGRVAFNSTILPAKFEELKETFKKFPDLNRVMKPSEQKVAKQQENEIKNKERREARDQVDLDEVVAALNNGEELDEVFAGLNDGEFTFMIDRESDQILNQCFCSILKATSQKACCSY
jgi:hypothetical protein